MTIHKDSKPEYSGYLDKEAENFLALSKYFSDMLSKHKLSDDGYNGEFVYASAASKNLFGWEPYELHGKTIFYFIHPNDRIYIEDCLTMNRLLKGEKLSYRLRCKEGDYIWVESTFYQDEKKRNEFFCITRNISKLKLAEEEIQDSEKKYRLLVEHSQDTIGIMTFDGHWIYINNGAKRLFGVTRPGEVIGKSLFDYAHKDDHERLTETLSIIKETNEPIEVRDLSILRTDRETRQVEVKFIPTNYKSSHTLQVVMRDITKRKKADELLQQAEKLTVVGQLAAGIAHEIRNPLTAIKGFTQLLESSTENRYIRVILQELDNIENIVSDLLVLAKPQVTQTEKTDIIYLLNRTITLLNAQAIMKNIEIVTDYEVEFLEIECEPDQLKQVFINIIKNALEAMENKGKKIYIKQRFIREDRILIRIIDEGVGIPQERLEKIGEPFYSTKEKGTGLGLMICQKIIQSHRGTMKIKSVLQKGTTVDITLPTILSAEDENIKEFE
ncbi:two-component system sporulation sensor kinase A [Scopulibacillus daqui]|uniref:histidine kinase n=1 Tax=Scopulibacillus daqui TaxID=1469162 RepID=A0ABS2Q033_9BACL|nr:PAS domain-containing sensor histidine kinase [Scopulibacillus daqui]MBM7645648.1 two-component system sporulation sensor kinase A [Scopulibacillus daqui]